MKALSLTQPWATLVAIGAKRIETRSWSTSYRGVVAIHASKGFPRECRELCASQPFLRELTRAGVSRPQLPLGGIVAIARLVYVCYTGDALNHRDFSFGHHLRAGGWQLTETERAFGNYSGGRFAWLLDRIVGLQTPVPCRGALGLWTVQPDIEQLVRNTEVA